MLFRHFAPPKVLRGNRRRRSGPGLCRRESEGLPPVRSSAAAMPRATERSVHLAGSSGSRPAGRNVAGRPRPLRQFRCAGRNSQFGGRRVTRSHDSRTTRFATRRWFRGSTRRRMRTKPRRARDRAEELNPGDAGGAQTRGDQDADGATADFSVTSPALDLARSCRAGRQRRTPPSRTDPLEPRASAITAHRAQARAGIPRIVRIRWFDSMRSAALLNHTKGAAALPEGVCLNVLLPLPSREGAGGGPVCQDRPSKTPPGRGGELPTRAC